jgi:hypothetical protein
MAELTVEDWAWARTAAPELEDALRRVCNIHRNQPVFDRSGKPSRPVMARLAGLSTPGSLATVGALLRALQGRGQGLADAGSGPPDSEFISQLAVLAAQGAAQPEDKIQPVPAGQGDREPDQRPEPEPHPISETDLARLQALLGELRASQPAVLAAVDGIRAKVEEGARAGAGDLAHLKSWQAASGDAARVLNLEPETFVLSALDQAVQAAASALAAKRQDAELRRMLDEIAGAAFSAETKPVFAAVAEQARTADPAAMPEETREAFRALHRLMNTPRHSMEQRDAENVQIAFGLPVLVVAAGALLAREDQPPEPMPPVPGEPVESASAGTSAAPSETAEPVDRGGEPPDATPDEPAAAITADGAAVTAAPAAAVTSAAAPADVGPAPVPGAPEDTEAGQPASAASLAKVEPVSGAPPAKVESASAAPSAKAEEPSSAPDRRIADAIAAGRAGLAYWYSVALNLPAPVQAAFEVFALSAAITVDGDDCSRRIRDLLQDFDVTAVAQNPEYIKVLAAGSARALLRMPFSPCSAVLQDAATLDSSAGTFLNAVLHAAAFGLEISKLQEEHGHSLAQLIAARDDALGFLSSAMETSKQLRTRYTRATNVWRRFVSDRGPLGGPISRVLAAPDNLEPAEKLLAQLRDSRDIDRLIDDTDKQLNPVAARRSKIVAGAREDLRQHTGELLDAFRSFVEAARAAAARQKAGSSDQLAEAVESLTRAVASSGEGDPPPEEPGSLALLQVRHWLQDILVHHAHLPSKELPVSTVLARDLSRCYEVQRRDDGAVTPASVTTAVLDALAGRSAESAYAGFVASDDHAGAEQLIDVLRAEGETELAGRLASRQQEDRAISRERLRELLTKTERELAQALYTALLSESESADLRGELEKLRDIDVADFATARQRLDGIVHQIAEARDRAITHARQQLASLNCADAVRERILRQLDDGDLVNAQEFLAQLAMGASGLPAEARTDDTLAAFWPEFVRAVEAAGTAGQASQPGLKWLRDAANAHEDLAGVTLLPPDASPMIRRGLTGWLALVQTKRLGASWPDSLKDVLQLLGLEVKGRFEQNPQRLQRWWTKFYAVPVGQAMVPSYGSSCGGHYQLLLCWDRMSPDRLLDLLEEGASAQPVIVLYFNTLSKQERRALAERSRPQHKNVSAVVVDNAVIAFLASRTETRLQTTMAITLPFTAINPYTPFVLGDVPREVFYGRREELRRVQDANDALFVYGGRQLGKSALLKTAMREFAEADSRWQSIYVDLKAEGVGEWREPDDIWPVLVPHMQKAGIIDPKVSAKAGPEVVVTQVRRWLADDQERRVLLLLDEADAFLETDARVRRGNVGDARFANIYRLKGLMDGSNRRFKPVFAGLHQVQRFHGASNGPMAHVGAEIPVGPLPPSEAYKLVVKPLAAIGYKIDAPDVAWRLLAYTNYQASLIQLFCDALVRRLHRRALSAGAPPTMINDRDIDEIYSDKEVRDQIATRFEWTINLDNRYRVIAYTTAWLTLNADGQTFATITLYDECKTFWPTGFAELTLDDFSAYLDEMVGLGVLVRTPSGEYGIRSPNVIRLLGAPEEIERRLEESERLEISRPFDPAMFRRALGSDPDRRSPLSEQQVQQILDGQNRVHVLVGSAALGLDRAVEALREAAPEDTEVLDATCDTINELMTSLSRAKASRRHIVLDLGDADISDQRAALRILYRRAVDDPQLTASCLAPPAASWLWESDDLDISVERVRIKPWTQDALRAWAPDCVYPLSTAQQRAQLLEATGGWPQLVEAAVRSARSGAAEARACQKAAASLKDGKNSMEFLLSVGLSTDPIADEAAEIASSWSDEITFDDLATLVEADRETVLASVGRLVNLAVLSSGSSGDSYHINPLIASLLRGE